MPVRLIGLLYKNWILINGELRDYRFLELNKELDFNKEKSILDKRKRYEERRNKYLENCDRPLEY